MKRLILMRHAKTEAWHEGIDDHGRALTTRGHADATRIGETLKSQDWIPDIVLVSTARRARETWLELQPIFDGAAHTSLDELYLTGVRGLEDIIRDVPRSDTLMIIGHNPGIHDLAREITRQAGSHDHHASLVLSEKMPTGAAALFEANEDGSFQYSTFKLHAFIRPKELKKS